MSSIGTVTPAKDGGWTGSIHTLTINTKLRFVPNDNRDSEYGPAFRVFVGQSRVGERCCHMEREKHPEGDGGQPANDNGVDTGKQIDLHTHDCDRLTIDRLSKVSREPPTPANDNLPTRRLRFG